MEDYCVICGAIVPEGLQVCPICEFKNGIRKDDSREMRILLASSYVSEFQSETKVNHERGTLHERFRNWTCHSFLLGYWTH